MTVCTWTCRAHSHEWRQAIQRLKVQLDACRGRGVAHAHRQLQEPTVLKQWVEAIAAPSTRQAHMEMIRAHAMGLEYILQVATELQWGPMRERQ